MSLESDIIAGNYHKVTEAIPNLPPDRVGSLFLFAITFEQEEIALHILRESHGNIDEKIICEAFKSSAAHNETALVTAILNICPAKITEEVMLESIRMATVRSYIDVIKAMKIDERFATIINSEDEENPHILMWATDNSDYWFIEKLLDLPEINVKFHHSAYASKKQQHKIAELLKLRISKEHAREDYDQSILRYEKDMYAVGPHMQVELERRKREQSRERHK